MREEVSAPAARSEVSALPVAQGLRDLALRESLVDVERRSMRREPLVDDHSVPGWSPWAGSVARAYAEADYVVVRGLPLDGDGAALLWALSCVSSELRTYRGDRVLKRFRMSPWTRALSHTLDEGHFHTDLNAAPSPPALTGMLCVAPDPSGPEHGQLRVARLRELKRALQSPDAARAATFLTETELTMVSDASPGAWTGRAIVGDTIRFHPETIRAADRRAGGTGERFDRELRAVKDVAMRVSLPVSLAPGDALIVSNVRAMHYRSACTVRFTRFPSEFESRVVCVAHGVSERTGA